MQITKVQNEEHKVVLVHILVILAYLESQENVCSHISVSTYRTKQWLAVSDNYWLITIGNYIQSHFFQFFKLRWVTCLPAPTIFMAFKMHPVYNNFC